MMIQVREYALLTCDNTQPASIDLGIVSEATFSWLEQLQQKWSGASQIITREGKRFLRLGSYVGYLQSPNGESIEILPKTTLEAPAEIVALRQLFAIRDRRPVAVYVSPDHPGTRRRAASRSCHPPRGD